MAILVAMVDGLGLFVWTLWGLQERRFSAIFDTLSSASRSLFMVLVHCFLGMRRRGEPGVPS